jgi:NTP pyrophosphatase (non-canonical NTP hydrolase)
MVSGLVAEVEEVAEQLGDEDATSDLEELARALRKVHDDVLEVAAMASYSGELGAAVRHLREACDLVDDGMPLDAVIFEVLAARARLTISLG